MDARNNYGLDKIGLGGSRTEIKEEEGVVNSLRDEMRVLPHLSG